MRRAASRTGARPIFVRGIRWRRAAVRNDDRRPIVAAAEGNARNVKLRPRMHVQIIAGGVAGGGARGTVFFELLRSDKQTDGIGKTAGKRGVAHSDSAPLHLVTVQQR